MDSPYVPSGPETAPTPQTSPQLLKGLSSTGLSFASAASIAVFLSLFGLVAIVTICWGRRRWTTSQVPDERPSEKISVHDVEFLAATRPIVPITPLPDVRWMPQIRSISGPAVNQSSDRKSVALPQKRARSPPPSIKVRNQPLDPYAKSAPAHALSFSYVETLRPPRGSGEEPPVTPQALAASGMQARSLGRHAGVVPES